jgi:hypothetical protein
MTASRSEAKRLYNIAERDAYRSWVGLHGPVKGGQKGFRAILRKQGMKVPHHYRHTARTTKESEAERKFVEEGLGREGHYARHRYPEATEVE